MGCSKPTFELRKNKSGPMRKGPAPTSTIAPFHSIPSVDKMKVLTDLIQKNGWDISVSLQALQLRMSEGMSEDDFVQIRQNPNPHR